MITEPLDSILKAKFHNTQSAIWWVVNKIVKQVMLEQLRNDASEKALDAHIEKVFESDWTETGFQKGL